MQSPILPGFDSPPHFHSPVTSELDSIFDDLEIDEVNKAQDFIDTCPQATSKELLQMSPQSLLRKSLLLERGEEWVRYCLEQQVCVDQIYSFCPRSDCPYIHIEEFGKEELFFRTARCWKGSSCETRFSSCRFWHDLNDGEKRVAQQNIAEALLTQNKARCTCAKTWQSCFYCLKCTKVFHYKGF
eukprot:c3754_g1_i1.p1 GENE.c3754_g1_i1~~c3754_g1_i1.p1  ORF type:complete len:185 (-),score=62.21 c3754_g1_i1:3-557(-)